MECPHCHKEIDNAAVARAMGARGGAKSRRTLDPSTAREMARKSAETRRKNAIRRNTGA